MGAGAVLPRLLRSVPVALCASPLGSNTAILTHGVHVSNGVASRCVFACNVSAPVFCVGLCRDFCLANEETNYKTRAKQRGWAAGVPVAPVLFSLCSQCCNAEIEQLLAFTLSLYIHTRGFLRLTCIYHQVILWYLSNHLSQSIAFFGASCWQ